MKPKVICTLRDEDSDPRALEIAQAYWERTNDPKNDGFVLKVSEFNEKFKGTFKPSQLNTLINKNVRATIEGYDCHCGQPKEDIHSRSQYEEAVKEKHKAIRSWKIRRRRWKYREEPEPRINSGVPAELKEEETDLCSDCFASLNDKITNEHHQRYDSSESIKDIDKEEVDDILFSVIYARLAEKNALSENCYDYDELAVLKAYELVHIGPLANPLKFRWSWNPELTKFYIIGACLDDLDLKHANLQKEGKTLDRLGISNFLIDKAKGKIEKMLSLSQAEMVRAKFSEDLFQFGVKYDVNTKNIPWISIEVKRLGLSQVVRLAWATAKWAGGIRKTDKLPHRHAGNIALSAFKKNVLKAEPEDQGTPVDRETSELFKRLFGDEIETGDQNGRKTWTNPMIEVLEEILSA